MLVFAAGCAVLALAATVGLLVDTRTLDASPIWVKPLKFALSGLAYGLTWSWLCSLIDRRARTVRRATAVVVGLLSLELLLIFGQALRGKHSHFNFETVFDAVLYEIMATSIVIVWCGALVLTVLVLRSTIDDRPRKMAIASGAVLSLIGVGLGALMTIPTGAQLTALEAGGPLKALGAHTVGAPDGGAGLPLLGWSTTGGDLRIPHFVGMHALQAMLVLHLLVNLLARRWPRLSPPVVRYRLMCIGAAGFAAVTALLTWQAYRGQPVSKPDVWTLSAFAAVAVGMAVATILTLRHSHHLTVVATNTHPFVDKPERHQNAA
jgi:hypothetical protein